MIEIIIFVRSFTFVRKMVESTNLKMLQKPSGEKKTLSTMKRALIFVISITVVVKYQGIYSKSLLYS